MVADGLMERIGCCKISPMLTNKRKKYLHHLMLTCDCELNNLIIFKVLVLFSKYYGEFSMSVSIDDNKLSLPWKDFILSGNEIFEATENKFFAINISTSFFMMNNNNLSTIRIPDAFTIYGGYNRSELEIAVDVFVDLFTDLKCISKYTEGVGWSSIYLNNHIAAKKNRKKLRLFLKELHDLTESKIVEFDSSYFSNKYIDSYGFSENVKYDGNC